MPQSAGQPLRLLQNGEVTAWRQTHPPRQRAGAAATNCNLENAIRQNAFREDLYYRLNVFTLNVLSCANAFGHRASINHFLDHFVAPSGAPCGLRIGYGCAPRLPVARQHP
ncbi:MAG: sigma 54-interacting transcriptional regulator [Bilophila wadsworthia]